MNKKLLNYGIFSLLFFTGFTFLINIKILDGLDLTITKFLQVIIPKIFDLPFSLLSLSGSAEIILIILLILKAIYKKLNILFILLGFVFFHVIELIQKAFINHVGPPHELVRYYFQFSFPSSSLQPGFSYPSGHMGRTVFLSVILVFIFWLNSKLSKKSKYILISLVLFFNLLMLISRVYLGEHWATDVIGGSLLGASMAFFALAL